jgi:hypothetical protein
MIAASAVNIRGVSVGDSHPLTVGVSSAKSPYSIFF